MKSKRSKATDIPQAVKKAVWERDNYCCIVCGKHYTAMPNAHFISRAKGGLGIEQNIVTLCNRCHYDYDQTTQRPVLKQIIREYLQSKYEDWNEEKLVYKKWEI